MTQKQIEEMSPADRDNFMKVTCRSFPSDLNLEEYAEAIRDYMYIWRHIEEKRSWYTFDYAIKRVTENAVSIRLFYDEKAPVEDAAVDVDYCCG